MYRAHRVFTLLRPARPRHPITQALFAVFAVCAFGVLLVVGAAVALIVAIVAAILRLLGLGRPIRVATYAHVNPHAQKPPADTDVIDGEYTVLRKSLPRITNQ
jgi:hypothetical protein